MPDASLPLPNSVNKNNSTIGYFGAFICLGLSTAALGPTLPGLANNTHSSLELVSSLFIGRSSGYMLGSLVGGRFYDRIPGNRLMAFVLSLMALMIFFVPTIPSLLLLAAVMFVLGFGEGTLDTGGNTLLTRVHPTNLGPYMNGLHFFFGVGTSITPIIIAQTTLHSSNLNWAYWCLALLFIPVIIWMYFQPSPSIEIKSHQMETHSGSSLVLTWLAAALLLLYVGAEVGFASWIYTYAMKLGLSNTTQAAYLTSLFWGAFTVGRLLAIPIAARVKAKTILLVDLVGSFLCLMIIVAFPISNKTLWISSAGTGFFFASIFPTVLVLAEQPIALTGRIMGFFLVGSSLGGMGVPWLIGQLIDPIGPQVMPVIVLVTIFLCFLVFICLAISSQLRKNPA